MKLNEATPEQKIAALAELDGWVDVKKMFRWTGHRNEERLCGYDGKGCGWVECKPYLNSYDAILPLVQKQGAHEQYGVFLQICGDEGNWSDRDLFALLIATPQQLADALLISTGKFEL